MTDYSELLAADRSSFDEERWINLLFLLSDTQAWLNEMIHSAVMLVPVQNKKRLFRKSYYITVAVIAHILERHYYKINRYPGGGKFTIPVTEILSCLRDAFQHPACPVPGTTNFQRKINMGRAIGFDQWGQPTDTVTIISDSGGRIITAFPGFIRTGRTGINE